MSYSDTSVLGKDLLAVQHFVNAFKKSNNRPIFSKNAHSLLVNVPHIKEHLMLNYYQDRLLSFFLKFPEYFIVDKDEEISLRNPELKLEETLSCKFFKDLLEKRKNRPIHVLNAHCFILLQVLESFLSTHYNLEDLSPFFELHNELFIVEGGQVRLRHYLKNPAPLNGISDTPKRLTSQKSLDNEQIETPSDLSRNQRRRHNKMENTIVEFFLDIMIKRNLPLDSRQAHSFFQKDYKDLREHLKTNYTLSQLKPFFEAHPRDFIIEGNYVYPRNYQLKEVPGPPVTSFQSPNPTRLPNAQVYTKVLEYTNPASTSKSPVSSSPASSVSSKNNTSSPASLVSSNKNPSSSASSVSNKKSSKDIPANSGNKKLLNHLMSLVLTTDTPLPNISNNPVFGAPKAEAFAKYCDASCQTISSGPILSLSVFHESESSP